MSLNIAGSSGSRMPSAKSTPEFLTGGLAHALSRTALELDAYSKWRMKQHPKVLIPTFAYTDETGNTGLNLFDPWQPFFWTGTLLTPVDLDRLDPAIHRACLERVGCTELHGNQLGLTGIEKVAGKLQRLLYRYRMRFLFTRVDKKHLAGTKFIDTLMDSGINQAVSNLHYGVRFHRLYLAQAIVALLTIEDRREFWEVYAKADAKGFVRTLLRLKGRVETYIEDPRTRQLLLDAIAWALVHPEPLLEGTRSEMDSPNVVALTLLIEMLHQGIWPNTLSGTDTFPSSVTTPWCARSSPASRSSRRPL